MLELSEGLKLQALVLKFEARSDSMSEMAFQDQED